MQTDFVNPNRQEDTACLQVQRVSVKTKTTGRNRSVHETQGRKHDKVYVLSPNLSDGFIIEAMKVHVKRLLAGLTKKQPESQRYPEHSGAAGMMGLIL